MNNRPLVTAIVVNWNGSRDLEKELPSLTTQTYESMEILIIDNGSTDDSASVVRSFPKARWLPLGRNIGLAGALNEGVRLSEGEFVLLLNDDMRFAKDFVEKLVAPLIEDKTIFASDAMQYDWDGKRIVHAATFLGSRNDRDIISLDKASPGLFIRQEMKEKQTPVLMASAANMMARKSLFLELDGLDRRYPMGYEDIDICWRAWVRGWKTIFVPSAICWHYVGHSMEISAEGARYRHRGTTKGRLLFSIKLLPLRYIITAEIFTLLVCIKDLFLLRWGRLADRILDFSNHVRRMPSLWRERRRLFDSSQKSPSAVWRQLSSLEE